MIIKKPEKEFLNAVVVSYGNNRGISSSSGHVHTHVNAGCSDMPTDSESHPFP